MNKFTEIGFNLVDDEEALYGLFGYDGYCAIRQAEQGLV